MAEIRLTVNFVVEGSPEEAEKIRDRMYIVLTSGLIPPAFDVAGLDLRSIGSSLHGTWRNPLRKKRKSM